MKGRKLNNGAMVVFSTEESQLIREWLFESFDLLEVGGRHRIAAVRLFDMLELIENEQLWKEHVTIANTETEIGAGKRK